MFRHGERGPPHPTAKDPSGPGRGGRSPPTYSWGWGGYVLPASTRPSAPEEGCGQLPSPPPGSPTLKIEPKLLGRGKAVAKKTPN